MKIYFQRLKFRCRYCGGLVVTENLRPGDWTTCFNCSQSVEIPADAELTDAEPSYMTWGIRNRRAQRESRKTPRRRVRLGLTLAEWARTAFAPKPKSAQSFVREIVSGVLMFAFLVVLALTNPSQAEHENAVYKSMTASASREMGFLGKVVGGLVEETGLLVLEYRNLIFFSFSVRGDNLSSIGLLGNVIVVEDW